MSNRNLASAAIRGWGWNDDLSNGKWLNEHCPQNNGPSDIDSEPWHHVLHNAHCVPHREATIEYKPLRRPTNGGALVSKGQEWLLKDRPGSWVRRGDSLQIIRRVWLVHYGGNSLASNVFELMADGRFLPVPHIDTPAELARLVCGWVWP